jgi:hypothetical protein
VGWPPGIKRVNKSLEALRDYLLDYYGAINEVKANARSVKDLLEEPEAAALYRKCKSMNTLLVSGGLLDQPHIWLLEWNIVENHKTLMESTTFAPGDSNA